MALSVDLRERVLAAPERREGSQRVLAERFAVSPGTVNAWLQLARSGQRAPREGGGGHAMLGGVDPEIRRGLAAERNDATLAQHADRLAGRTGRRFDPSTPSRALPAAARPAAQERRRTPANGIGPTSPPSGRRGGGRCSPGPIPTG